MCKYRLQPTSRRQIFNCVCVGLDIEKRTYYIIHSFVHKNLFKGGNAKWSTPTKT